MAEPTRELIAASEQDMLALGARLARAAGQGSAPLVVYLSGQLGAGKTTLVRGALRAWGVTGLIRSPTFTLLETYDLHSRTIAHLDLYRLDAPDIEALGLRDLLEGGNVLFVEWPERASGELPAADVRVSFGFTPDGGRRLDISPRSAAGIAVVQDWVS